MIASQAVISGAFSVTRQAVRLGFLPRLTIRHTSQRGGRPGLRAGGQLGASSSRSSRSSSASAPREQLAVGLRHRGHRHAGDRHAAVLRRRPRRCGSKPLWLVDRRRGRVPDRRPHVLRREPARRSSTAAGSRSRSPRSCSACSPPGSAGARSSPAAAPSEEGPLRDFVEEVRDYEPPVARAPGTAIFLNANPETTPLALRANVEHNHVLHESVRDRLADDASASRTSARTSA